MNTPAPIHLERVSRWYGDVLGVNEVTLNFGPGVTGLLGPNGAGKSTLIKLICGFLRPSIGRVRVLGKNPFTSRSVHRDIGLCPEQDPAAQGVSAHDELTYLNRLQGFAREAAETLAGQVLEQVGLREALHRPVATYSKGMRQRFKLAQAIAHEPHVVVLDEPMNGLDPPARREFADLIRGLGDAGRCVIVSSHILHEVEMVAERILVMEHGRLLADGTARELRAELNEVPLTIRIATPSPGAVGTALVGLDGVQHVERQPGALVVRTTDAQALFDALGRMATRDDAPAFDAVEPTDESLEAVFGYLTR